MLRLLFIISIIQLYYHDITVYCSNEASPKHFFRPKVQKTMSNLDKDAKGRMLLVLATNFCNESQILEEYIHHYYNEGVEHFYMYDQCNSTEDVAILQPFVDSGLVSLTRDSDVEYKLDPYRYYNRVVMNRLHDTWPKWLITTRIDEYYFAPHHRTLIDALQDVYNSCSGVMTPGVIYGSSGIVENVDSMVQSFVNRVDMSSQQSLLSGFSEMQYISKVINLESIDSKTLRHIYKTTHKKKKDICMSFLVQQKRKRGKVSIVNAEALVTGTLGYKPYLYRVNGTITNLSRLLPHILDNLVSKSVIVRNVYRTRNERYYMKELIDKQYNTINGYILPEPLDYDQQYILFKKYDQNAVFDMTLADRPLRNETLNFILKHIRNKNESNFENENITVS